MTLESSKSEVFVPGLILLDEVDGLHFWVNLALHCLLLGMDYARETLQSVVLDACADPEQPPKDPSRHFYFDGRPIRRFESPSN